MFSTVCKNNCVLLQNSFKYFKLSLSPSSVYPLKYVSYLYLSWFKNLKRDKNRMTSWTIFSSMTPQRDNAISRVSVRKWNGWRFIIIMWCNIIRSVCCVTLNNRTILVILPHANFICPTTIDESRSAHVPFYLKLSDLRMRAITANKLVLTGFDRNTVFTFNISSLESSGFSNDSFE